MFQCFKEKEKANKKGGKKKIGGTKTRTVLVKKGLEILESLREYTVPGCGRYSDLRCFTGRHPIISPLVAAHI